MREIQLRDAKASLSAVVDDAVRGEPAIITRHGKPVAQLVAPPPERRKVIFGGMKGRIKFYPGWDDPIDEDRFLAGEL